MDLGPDGSGRGALEALAIRYGFMVNISHRLERSQITQINVIIAVKVFKCNRMFPDLKKKVYLN